MADARLGMRWSEFVESLGIPYPGVKPRRDWSAEAVLSEIRRWHAEGHHTNVTTMSGVMTSPFFGQPIAAAPPRRVEVGARLSF